MADLRNFSITRAGTVNLNNVPTWTISGQVVEANWPGAATKVDFSGANVVKFPQVLGSLTAAQQDKLVEMIVLFLLEAKGIL